MERYETIFISRPDLEEKDRDALQEKLTKVISTKKGKVHLAEVCGKFKLAYEVKSQMKGNFHYVGYEADEKALFEFERGLRLNESVIKFLTCRVEEEAEFDSKLAPFTPRRGFGGRGQRHGHGPGQGFGGDGGRDYRPSREPRRESAAPPPAAPEAEKHEKQIEEN